MRCLALGNYQTLIINEENDFFFNFDLKNLLNMVHPTWRLKETCAIFLCMLAMSGVSEPAELLYQGPFAAEAKQQPKNCWGRSRAPNGNPFRLTESEQVTIKQISLIIHSRTFKYSHTSLKFTNPDHLAL